MPSILAADFARLGEQVAEAERVGADRIRGDVMDGHFVPTLSMGAPIVHSLRCVTRLPLEIHLMVSDPDSFLDESVEAVRDGARESPAGDAPHAAPRVRGGTLPVAASTLLRTCQTVAAL